MLFQKQFTSSGTQEILRPGIFLPGLFAACFLFWAQAASGQSAAGFERLGPFGGTVRSLLVVSKNPEIVYLGTSDGQIFKSTDGGAGWRPLYPGVNRRQLVIDTLVEDPADADHIFAGGWDLRSTGGGLYESLDGGGSWSPVRLPVESAAVRDLAVSAQHPATMIAGTLAGVFLTTDGGRTWKQSGSPMAAFRQVESVAIDPVDPRLLFVGTWHLGYRSTDFGKTWKLNDQGMINDSDVFSLAVDEKTPGTLYASACTGLYRSQNRGVSWTRLKVFPKSYLVRAHVVYIDPSDSTRIYGGTTEGLFLSGNSGQSWSRITPADLIIHAVQVDSSNPRRILIGTEVHGVLRSEDGGRTWVASNTGFVSRTITTIHPEPGKSGRYLVGELSEGRIGGFHIYDNPIHSWLPVRDRDVPGEGLLCLTALPDGRGRIAGTSKGAFLQPPGSTGWKALAGPIGKLTVYSLEADSREGWIFAGTDDGVYRARADELFFRKPPNYSLVPHVYSLLVSRADSGHILAGTHMGILSSQDSGATWEFSSAGIPDHSIVECLTSFPSDPNHVLAGTSAGLFESKDGGHTWEWMKDGRLGVDISSVVFLDDSGKLIAAGDNSFGGILLSEDGGDSWRRIENPEFASRVRTLAADPLHPGVLYIGTATEGVYRLTIETGVRPPAP